MWRERRAGMLATDERAALGQLHDEINQLRIDLDHVQEALAEGTRAEALQHLGLAQGLCRRLWKELARLATQTN